MEIWDLENNLGLFFLFFLLAFPPEITFSSSGMLFPSGNEHLRFSSENMESK